MTKNTTTVTTSYVSPFCEIVDIKSEAILCASMEQLVKYEKDYEW